MPPIDKSTSPVAVMSVSIRSALNIEFSSALPVDSMFRNAPDSVSSVVDQMSYRPEEIFNTGVLRHHEIEGAGSADMLQRENADLMPEKMTVSPFSRLVTSTLIGAPKTKGSP